MISSPVRGQAAVKSASLSLRSSSGKTCSTRSRSVFSRPLSARTLRSLSRMTTYGKSVERIKPFAIWSRAPRSYTVNAPMTDLSNNSAARRPRRTSSSVCCSSTRAGSQNQRRSRSCQDENENEESISQIGRSFRRQPALFRAFLNSVH